jgi:ferredoxin-NADP reductase
VRPQTQSSRTLSLAVEGWPGHLAGQHVDLRLTAPDGYTAQRSYSLSAPAAGEVVEVTVQRVAGGEVSPFLVDEIELGDRVEVRGPLGGWFVWRPDQPEPVLLLAGGSGIAPLMAMLRQRSRAATGGPFRLIYSARTPHDVYFADQLRTMNAEVAVLYTRAAPEGYARAPHRVDAADLRAHGWPPQSQPTSYVCGPTPFVEAMASLLVEAGHDPARIRTERFGASGG